MGLLSDDIINNHHIEIENNRLKIGSIDSNTPFNTLPLNRVHGIVNFEKYVAIVLHSSIIFLSKKDDESHVHIKMENPTFWQRICSFFRENR